MPQNATQPSSLRENWTAFYIGGAVACLLYIINAYYTPIPLWPIAGHDDGHFLSQGAQIARGHWLGRYDQMTLIKGPGFPFFLALGSFSHLPYSIFLALFQAGSFALLSLVVGRLACSPRLALALLMVLLTFPWIWSSPDTRILRDGVYTPQIFIFLALCVPALWTDMRRPRLVATLAGLTLGWISITREETPWLYPVIGLLVLVSLFLSWRLNRPVRGLVIGIICIGAGFAGVRAAVSTINYVKYRGFLVADITETNFRRALAAIFSVGGAEEIEHIPIPELSREAIYQVSPAFTEFRPVLEGEKAPLRGWQQAGCATFGGPACHDYAYPWFMWAFRDAAAATGHYKNAGTAARFYRGMWLEIESACKAGRLTCRYSPLAEMPPPVPGSFQRALAAVIRALAATTMLGEQAPDRMDSLGPPDMVAAAQAFLNGPLVEPTRLRPQQDPPAIVSTESPPLRAVRTIQAAIKTFYRIIWPGACVFLVLLLPIATFFAIRRRHLDYVMLVAWIFTALAASRILLLSFMSGYMYNVVTFEYLTPAPYALLVAVVACCYSLLGALPPQSLTRKVQHSRRLLSERFVFGTGIEVGAGSRPFPLPKSAVCRYGDIRDRASLRGYFSTNRVTADHTLDAQTFAGIPDNVYDYVISAHVIEHLEDPIGAIKNSLRVLKPGGVLLLAVPDRRYTFDRLRPGTPLEHILQDFQDGGLSTRLDAYKEHARYVHPAITGILLSDDLIENDAARIMAAKMDAHFHCWTTDEFRDVLSYCCEQFGAAIEAIEGPVVNENLFVARKLGSTRSRVD
jgi:hypothetical protein